MFIRCTIELPIPLAEVEKRLDGLRTSLEEWAGVAYREGEQLTARVGPTEQFAKKVHLELGMAEIHRRGLVYPVRWTATGPSAVFPTLTADLVLSHRGPEATHLTLEGTYQPPLGALGRVVDRLALRKVAEATVRSWLERVAAALWKQYPVSYEGG